MQRDRGSAAPYFNPEEHISQKREWSRRYTQQEGGAGGGEGREDRLYEHFAVVVSWDGILCVGSELGWDFVCWW